MKEHKHLGVYGLLIKDGKILLIKKCTGPYDGKLDLPGGTMKFGERPFETLRREFLEETGIEILDFSLLILIQFLLIGILIMVYLKFIIQGFFIRF